MDKPVRIFEKLYAAPKQPKAQLNAKARFLAKVTGLQLIFQAFLLFCITTAVLSTLTGCDAGTVNDTEAAPGNENYVPPGWSDPALVYEKKAYFPAEITDYRQAPGQFANSSSYQIEGNTNKLLGSPSGNGVYAADNSSIVSLGMAGGYAVFRFEPPLENYTKAESGGGFDFIVYGNAFYNGSSLYQEPGVIWVMQDTNSNNIPDDTWYVIPGSHLDETSTPVDIRYKHNDFTDTAKSSWWPSAEADKDELFFTGVFILSDGLFTEQNTCSGYADTYPTLKRGDLNANGRTDDVEDYPGIDPAFFYTKPALFSEGRFTAPDAPEGGNTGEYSGGGMPVDISEAVYPETFAPADLEQVSWIKIVSATVLTAGELGEYSCEIDAICRVQKK